MKVVVDDLDVFGRCGPTYLFQNHDPWSHENSERAAMACLVQAVYALDKDRSLTAMGLSPLAPDWYMPFKYKLIRVFHEEDLLEKEEGKQNVQENIKAKMKTVMANGISGLESQMSSVLELSASHSVVGAVFKWSRMLSMSLIRPSIAPKVVVAIRGTIPFGDTLANDLAANIDILMLQLQHSPRYKVAFKFVKEAIDTYGASQVSIAGHSLGAALCLLIGRTLALDKVFIRAHLFNPPFPSFLNMGPCRNVKDIVKVKAIDGSAPISHGNAEENQLVLLQQWCPNVYINRHDPICESYIAYFNHNAYKGSVIRSLLQSWRGREAVPFHNILSAHLYYVDSPFSEGFLKAHGMKQWWSKDTHIHTQLSKSLQ